MTHRGYIGIKGDHIFQWKLIVVFFLLLFLSRSLNAQRFPLNDKWEFRLLDTGVSRPVTLPHTWNARDIIDEKAGYYRGTGLYSTKLFADGWFSYKKVSIYFEGVCLKATVSVNGQVVGVHNGAYTGFSVPISEFLKFKDTNLIQVRVDNSQHLSDSIPPFSGDFSLMGGIYRDVWLDVTNPTHFEGLHGSSGILFTTPYVDENSAAFNIKLSVLGMDKLAGGRIRYELKKGGIIRASEITSVPPMDTINFTFIGSIKNPVLWSPEKPELYQLVVQIQDAKKEIIEEVVTDVGFRWFGISSKNEFLLNGKPYKLRGASRHQDYEGIGSALPDSLHWNDIKLMKEMGCNFIRIAHYPQDPAIYEACDKLGLISWSEIPVVDKVVNTEAFHNNCEVMMKEMILQQYNHPSIAIWGYHNEVRNLDTATVSNAERLNRITKQLDAYRLTAMAFESNLENGYFSNPLFREIAEIPEILGYNVYEGWYRGTIETVPEFLQVLHQLYPSKPMMVSEFGAGSSQHIHTRFPTIFDFSEEYQCRFQEPYLDELDKYPWLIGLGIWNFIDFQRDGREDVQPNINNKGMVTTSRQPKDVFYLYKSRWTTNPFIYIAGKSWKNRSMIIPKGFPHFRTEQFIVYSNITALQFSHNGTLIAPDSSFIGKTYFTVTLNEGRNFIMTTNREGTISDTLTLNYTLFDLENFSRQFPWKSLSFNTGQTRTYYTDHLNFDWIPDKHYRPGSWGYVQGTPYNTWNGNRSWDGIREGIHKPVKNTVDEPVYQTFVEGLHAWRADVPAGKYRVTLYLAEPFTSEKRENIPRIMNITLNDQPWVNNLDLEKKYGILTAITLEKEISTRKDIIINFDALSGYTLLNGVRIEKLK